MTKYINPYTDFGFKKLFGEEGSKDILIDFLNQLLPPRHQIAELNFVNTEQLPDNLQARKAFFDIRCTSTTGERFIIEMQKGKINHFKDRTLYYLTFPIGEQAPKGDWNYELEPVYFVGILDFFFEDAKNAKFKTFVTLKDQDNKEFYNKLGIIYLQMPAFNKTEDQLETKMDKWAYFLKNLESFDKIPQILNEPVFQHAFKIAEFVKLPKEQREFYEKSRLDYVGFKEANIASFEEGEKKGIEIGKKERDIEIAKGMKVEGLSISIIKRLTGLTEQEINEL